VEETGAAIPLPEKPAEIAPSRAHSIPRWLAAIQALMVSGIPTQLVVVAIMMVGFRVNPFDQASLENAFSLEFMAVMLLVDTALTAVLIRVFLEMSGEDSRTVFLGKRPALGEILRGIALAPAIIIGVSVLTLSLRQVAPWLHTVKESPYVKYMDTPLDAAVFLVVVVLGAAVKEELQRAFVLHRFEHYLGGRRVGLLVFSSLFGILHFDQGVDVAVSIGLLGLFWGVLYLKRRNAVITMASHATFNAAQVIQVMLARALGVSV
jgi:membrane protease YdiL (CAAX protease family)